MKNTQYTELTHNSRDWSDYIPLIRDLCTDADVFGTDPFCALEVVGMALERTHAEMTKADEFFTQNVLGFYREQLELAKVRS